VDTLPAGFVSVGNVVGAVNTPLLSIVPQEGSQVSDCGFGLWSFTFVDAVFGCTTMYLADEGSVFNSDTLNVAFCAGFIPTGTVAEVGVTDTRIPVSSATCPAPVFFVSASAAAVNVSTGIGFGKLPSEGAVYVSTLELFEVEVTHDPTFPPFKVDPDVHVPVTAFGVGLAVVGSGR
jgi:hypothetical protein